VSCGKLKVLFFGATADIVGAREVSVDISLLEQASSVFQRVIAEHPALSKHRLLFAVNQQYTKSDEIVKDGDELAIFTAVSGG